MKIGDIVRYVLTSDLVLGIVVGMHETNSLFKGRMTLYHIEWLNDGGKSWQYCHHLTHEPEERLEVIQ